MKALNILPIALFFSLLLSCNSNRILVEIPAKESIAIKQAAGVSYQATIKNKSLKQFTVKVEDKNNQAFLSGFGLGAKGKADVPIGEKGQLVLINETNQALKAWVLLQEDKERPTDRTSKTTSTNTATPSTTNYISFTLVNNSNKSIPLLIPSVMNPNLSPKSRSGVDLQVGQEILFKAKGRKYVLLKVDNTIKDGVAINIDQLLQARKQELGL